MKLVIPGRRRRQVYAACVNLAACGAPGIYNHRPGLWIPGSRPFGPRPGMTAHVMQILELRYYPYALRTRKSAGLMTRKLSVTESQKTAQFFGTSMRRKCRTDRQKSL